MKFEENDGIKRSNPGAGEEDHNAQELVPKKSKLSSEVDEQVSQKEDLELMMKSNSEISKIIERTKKNLQLLADKLPDKGAKIKANLQRYEYELQRRKNDLTTSSPDCIAQDKPSDGVDVQGNAVVDLDLVMKINGEIRETTVKNAKYLQTLGDKFPDNGDRIKAAPCRNEDELEGRNKVQPNKRDFTTSSPVRLAGNKPSESHSGVAAAALTIDPAMHDSLTDEKMQKIVNELVNIGISETDVGKAAEVCYNDSVKVKVLFALPSHLRKLYVWGFLRNSA